MSEKFGDKNSDGTNKDYKFITKNCISCGVEMVTKLYVDATPAEIAEVANTCIMCREKALDPNRRIYICSYCSNGLFRINSIYDPNNGQWESDVRCSKCGYNEQKMIEKQ